VLLLAELFWIAEHTPYTYTVDKKHVVIHPTVIHRYSYYVDLGRVARIVKVLKCVKV